MGQSRETASFQMNSTIDVGGRIKYYGAAASGAAIKNGAETCYHKLKRLPPCIFGEQEMPSCSDGLREQGRKK